jgi:hypothetical protein
MFKRPVKIPFLLLLLVVMLTAVRCESVIDIIKGPNFSNIPKIEPRPPRIYRNIIDQLGNRADSVILVLHFEDGDGDLGLTSDDRQNNPKFQQNNPDGTPNRYWNNYFAEVERKVNGEFVPANAGVPFSGAFPPLKPDGKPGPIEGELEYSLLFPLSSSPPNDTLRFRIQIVDRERQESNVIQTEPIVVNPR